MRPGQDCCGLVEEWSGTPGRAALEGNRYPWRLPAGCGGGGSHFEGESLDFF